MNHNGIAAPLKLVLAGGAALVLVAACAPRNVDYDGRRDFNDNPRERVCCKYPSGRDAVMTRKRCWRTEGRPVHMRQCRRG